MSNTYHSSLLGLQSGNLQRVQCLGDHAGDSGMQRRQALRAHLAGVGSVRIHGVLLLGPEAVPTRSLHHQGFPAATRLKALDRGMKGLCQSGHHWNAGVARALLCTGTSSEEPEAGGCFGNSFFLESFCGGGDMSFSCTGCFSLWCCSFFFCCSCSSGCCCCCCCYYCCCCYCFVG